MLGALRNILLFMVGVLLAILFVYQGGVTSVGAILGFGEGDETGSKRARLGEELSYDDARLKILEPGYPAERRAGLLREALEEGTFDSLQLVRSEYLKALPDYEASLLPLLKRASLGSLISRFTVSDWEDWAHSETNLRGGASAARLYVEDIKTVNPELGSFLDTSAFLLSGLHQKTKDGRVFVAEDFMEYLLENAEHILAHRKQRAVPARFLFTPHVVRDPAFVTVLERERGNVVSAYLQERPQNVQIGRRLLATLEPRLLGTSTYDSVAQFLVHIATKASPRLRETFLYSELEDRSIESLSHYSKKIRILLAQLYVMAAVDSMETGDDLQASRFLRESVNLEPGMRIQRLVATALQNRSAEQLRRSEAKARERAEQIAPRMAAGRQDERVVSWFMLGILIIGFCAVPLGVVFVLNRLRMRSSYSRRAAQPPVDHTLQPLDWHAEGGELSEEDFRKAVG